MAFLGLFGNYDKPGPGVDKDEPKKAAPVRFFEILWRKLSKLVQLNLTFMIPFIVVIALMVGAFLLPIFFMQRRSSVCLTCTFCMRLHCRSSCFRRSHAA